jgi:hypothetical protein
MQQIRPCKSLGMYWMHFQFLLYNKLSYVMGTVQSRFLLVLLKYTLTPVSLSIDCTLKVLEQDPSAGDTKL